MKLMFQDLTALLPILRGYECVEDLWMWYTSSFHIGMHKWRTRKGVGLGVIHHRYWITRLVILYPMGEMDMGREVSFHWN